MAAGHVRRTVAIWGSCVTRDAFAVESRAAQLEEYLPLVYYGARSSWVSQDSRPFPATEADLGGLTGFGLRMVSEDLAKNVIDRLVEHRPGRYYLNAGQWMIDRSYAVIDEGEIRLMRWPATP